MDFLIIILGGTFLTLIGVGGFLLLKSPSGSPPSSNPKINETTLSNKLEKKIKKQEEQINQLELELEAARLEVNQLHDKKNNLVKEKDQAAYDKGLIEKLGRQNTELKQELLAKEEILEKEISDRRNTASELQEYRTEREELHRRTREAEDDDRKSKTMVDSLTKELDEIKRTLKAQSKIVNEHSQSKKEGDWISREEFVRVEKELEEKEAFIQKLLSIKKDQENG